MSTDVEKIAAEIKALAPPDKLRLAADLMEQRRGDTAYLIAKSVVEELGADDAGMAVRGLAADVMRERDVLKARVAELEATCKAIVENAPDEWSRDIAFRALEGSIASWLAAQRPSPDKSEDQT